MIIIIFVPKSAILTILSGPLLVSKQFLRGKKYDIGDNAYGGNDDDTSNYLGDILSMILMEIFQSIRNLMKVKRCWTYCF